MPIYIDYKNNQYDNGAVNSYTKKQIKHHNENIE